MLRLLVASDDALFDATHVDHAEYVRNGSVVVGRAAAVRRDHVLVGTTAGVATTALPFDFLVLAVGTAYRSEIKTAGVAREHRRRAFLLLPLHHRLFTLPTLTSATTTSAATTAPPPLTHHAWPAGVPSRWSVRASPPRRARSSSARAWWGSS